MNLLDSNSVKRELEPTLRHLQAFIDGEWGNKPIEDLAIDWQVTEHNEHTTCYRFDGEHADGQPSWVLYDEKSYWRIQYDLGWHEQAGEAKDLAEAVVVMSAMVAAGDALEAVLSGGK